MPPSSVVQSRACSPAMCRMDNRASAYASQEAAVSQYFSEGYKVAGGKRGKNKDVSGCFCAPARRAPATTRGGAPIGHLTVTAPLGALPQHRGARLRIHLGGLKPGVSEERLHLLKRHPTFAQGRRHGVQDEMRLHPPGD
jgi:hypothetical protein